MQTFFGVEVVPGKLTPFVPPPIDAQLHLSQATLSLDAKAGERVGVTAKVDEDGPDVLICSLREGTSESQNLDLIFNSYAEFKVVGNASVHLSGYYMPEHDEEDYDEDEEDEEEEEEDIDEDEELGNITAEDLKALAAYGRKHGLPDADDDEDEDEDDDEDDDVDDDEDDDEDEDLDEEAAARTVIIRELNHDGSEMADTDEDDEEEEDDDDDDDLDAEDAEVAPGGGVQIDEDIAPETAVAMEAPSKRKSAAAEKEAPMSKKAKKAADIAKAVADDLILAAMDEDEDDDEDEDPEKDADDIIDVAAAVAAPAVEDVTATADAAAEPEVVEAEAADQKPLSKKEKKRRAKAAAGNGQITVDAAELRSKSVAIKHTRPKVQKFDNGFIIEDTHMGPAQGKEAKPGNKVGVRYKGWLAKNNKVFDQTKGSKTFKFRVGVGEVIKGWDRGVVGMRPGDKRRLTVPPQMAYGTTGVSGAIPGNATLVFDVELVDVKGK